MEPPKIGPLKLTQQILRSEGIKGLFHGLTPTFAREMPGYFCFFFAYEASREILTPEGKNSSHCSRENLTNNLIFSNFYRDLDLSHKIAILHILGGFWFKSYVKIDFIEFTNFLSNFFFQFNKIY